MATSAGSTEERPLEIDAGALFTLQSAFPKNAENVRIVLSADRFTLDDVLPLVLPKPKPILLYSTTSPAFPSLSEKLLRSLEAAMPVADAASADLTLSSYNPLDPTSQEGNAVVFVEDETRTGAWLKGGIVAEEHPLMDGLNWQSLLVRETIQLELRSSDTVLLWQEKRPLIVLRDSGNQRQLLFNFDPSLSNAEKQPAFIVLLHRFAESIRTAKVAPFSANLETGQALDITIVPDHDVRVLVSDCDGKPQPDEQVASTRHAPLSSGFLKVVQDKQSLLDAAVHFSDPRESDFSACDSGELEDLGNSSDIERHTQADPLWRVCLLLLLALLMLSWKFTSKAEPA
jgi:hypothetical protein